MLLNQSINEQEQNKNFFLLLWQSFFFLLTINILDKDTILPGMLSKMGADEFLIGLLSVITIGLPKFSQIFFGLILQNKPTRKKYLLHGFGIRILSLFIISYILWQYYLFKLSAQLTIGFILLLFFIYSLAAAYTSVAVIDLAPRALFYQNLKKFYSLKQIGYGLGIIVAILIVRPMLKIYPYPLNYSVIHVIAGISLIISTLVFFCIKEKIIISKLKFSLNSYFKFVFEELKKNKSLLYLSLIVNSEGLFLSIIPFFTTLAISKFSVNVSLIGSLFVWKIAGALISSIILSTSKNYDYFNILAINILISIIAPLIIILFANYIITYKIIFFLVGVFASFYRITYEGLLIEISNDKNRATYASVLGSSNIATFIIPLLSGILISVIGYSITLVSSSLLLFITLYFMHKLKRLITYPSA